MSVAPVTDWALRLRGRVYQQFANTAWAPGIANAVGAGADEVDAALVALLALFSIDPVTGDAGSAAYGIGRGVQLDRIGRLLGQPRGAADDDTYRPILRARILVNRSLGTADDIIGIFLAMFSGAGAPLITKGWIAEFAVRLVGVVMSQLLVSAAVGLLRAGAQAGQYAVLEYLTVDGSVAFAWDSLEASQAIGNETDPTVGGALGGALAAS